MQPRKQSLPTLMSGSCASWGRALPTCSCAPTTSRSAAHSLLLLNSVLSVKHCGILPGAMHLHTSSMHSCRPLVDARVLRQCFVACALHTHLIMQMFRCWVKFACISVMLTSSVYPLYTVQLLYHASSAIQHVHSFIQFLLIQNAIPHP